MLAHYYPLVTVDAQVGPATCTAVLAVGAGDVPFMSDEAMVAGAYLPCSVVWSRHMHGLMYIGSNSSRVPQVHRAMPTGVHRSVACQGSRAGQ